jgi:hypothetical protein
MPTNVIMIYVIKEIITQKLKIVLKPIATQMLMQHNVRIQKQPVLNQQLINVMPILKTALTSYVMRMIIIQQANIVIRHTVKLKPIKQKSNVLKPQLINASWILHLAHMLFVKKVKIDKM